MKGQGISSVTDRLLIDDEKNSREPSEMSSSEDEKNYMAFMLRVKYESYKEKVEKVERSENFEKECEEELVIHKAYQLLFKESVKIKKVNKALLRKVIELKRETERLVSDLKDSSKTQGKLKCVNEK